MSDFRSEAAASVALDSGAGGTRRCCNNPDCSKDYQHTEPCDVPFAHAAPPVHPMIERKIESRWNLFWENWVRLKLKIFSDGSVIKEVRARHRAAALECLNRRTFRLPWRIITGHNLDDPLLEPKVRSEKIRQFKRDYRRMCECHSVKKQSPTSL